MGINVKDIRVEPIRPDVANAFVKRYHYSGRVVHNSQLHLGAFYSGILHGVMSFGPSLDKHKIQGLVAGTRWNEFLELNRMAFDDYLPKNSESRCLSVAMRIIKKQYPWIKWIVSFADGTRCGDGAIYRASGFVLTMIKKNTDCMITDNGIVHTMTIKSSKKMMKKYGNWKIAINNEFGNAKPLVGFQLRYIYFIDKSCLSRLTVPVIPFSRIAEIGASMYKGERISRAGSVDGSTSASQVEGGGSIPTPALTEVLA